MKYRCRGCNRFIGQIKSPNNMNLNGKSIEIRNNTLVITCKCGEVNIIDLERYLKKRE